MSTEFTRDPRIESLAFQNGWSLDKIRRTRVSDLKQLFDAKKSPDAPQQTTWRTPQPIKAIVELSRQSATPPPPKVLKEKQKFNNAIDLSDMFTTITSPEESYKYTSPVHKSPIKRQPRKGNPHSPVSPKDDDEVLQLATLASERKRLQQELDNVSEREKSAKNALKHKTNSFVMDDFQVRDVCKLSDAPIRINTFFESICVEYEKQKINWEKKKELVLKMSEEFDEEEQSLIQQSTMKDQSKMKMLIKRLQDILIDMHKIIKKKANVLEILENSYDENGHLMLKMRGKLSKLQMVAVVIDQKLKEWNNMFVSHPKY
jgi:hypothetical protein